MQSLYFYTFGCGVAVDDTLVALVGHFLADIFFVVGHKDALSVSTVFLVQLHYGMHSSSAARKEVKYCIVITI